MSSAAQKVAVAGLGGIGSGIAQRLADAGYQLLICNRTAARSAEVAAATNARQAPSFGAAAREADVVIVSLSDEPAVEDVVFGQMLPELRHGVIVINASTVSPSYSRAAKARLAGHGIGLVEACVIGNPQMARAGELRVFAAGDQAEVDAVRDVLAALGRQGMLYLGPIGRASTMKLAFNFLLGAQTAALAEMVTFAERAGLDRELLLTALMKSGWRSPVLNYRAEIMRTRRFEQASFRAELMAKDLRLVVTETGAAGLDLPIANHVAALFADIVSQGHGAKDAAIVVAKTGRVSGGARDQHPSPLPQPPPAQPVDNPFQYVGMGTAFCTAKILLTALELGLFRLLRDEGPAAEPRIAELLGLHPRGSRDFLDALVGLGLLERSGADYRNSPGVERHLIPGEQGYIGGFLERANQRLYPAWGQFTEALRTGKPQGGLDGAEPYDTMSADPEQLASFLAMMDTMNGQLGPALAAAFDWTRHKSVVDIGGARGNLLAPIVAAHPHLTAAVFDVPQVEPFFDEHMRRLGLNGQVAFRKGDFFADPMPSADVLVVGHVLHDWAPQERRQLVKKAFCAVNPGGALIVYDPMLDPDQPALVNLVISLDMLLTTRAGSEYSPAECRSWLADAGFAVDPPLRIGFSDTMLVGRKPNREC